MTPIQTLDAELNQMILSGKLMDAFERYYADNVVMQENSAPPTAGKAENRVREEKFLASVEQVHELALTASGASADTTFGVWTVDATYKGGPRVRLEQVAVRQWKEGKVVSERFFHA